jgi:hypothetical protein
MFKFISDLLSPSNRKPTKVSTKKKKSKPFPKKEIGFDTITGYYDREHLKIKFLIRKIAALNYTVAYVGATSDIETRWDEYPNWKFRHVLYETTSFEMAKFAEKELIKYTNNKFWICNKSKHSKGLKDGKEKYYVYLLADKQCHARA